MNSQAAAWGPPSHQLERVRVLLGLRRLVLVWQGPDGDWKHMVRCREDMLPQAETRLLDDLFAVHAEGVDGPGWQALLSRWHAREGWFRTFHSLECRGFYLALLETDGTPGQHLQEWLDLVLPALASAANDSERREALHGQRQALLEIAVSLAGSQTESDVRAYALRLARRLFSADRAAWLGFAQQKPALLSEDSDTDAGGDFWRLSAEALATLQEGKPVLLHRPEPRSDRAGKSVLASTLGSSSGRSLVVLQSRQGHTFSEYDQFTFAVFCRQLEIALDHRRLLSRLRAANAELTSAQARLVESARLQTLGEVASSVAHDFNNVLGALLGRVQLLQHKNSNAQVQSALAKMERILGEGEAAVKRLQEAARGRRSDVKLTLDGLVRDVFSAEESVLRHDAQINDRKIAWLTEFLPTGHIEQAARLRPVLRQFLAQLSRSVPTDSVIELATARRAGTDLFTITVASDPAHPDLLKAWSELEGFAAFQTALEHAGARITQRVREGEASLEIAFAAPSEELSAEPLRVLVVDDDSEVRDVLSEMLITAGHEVKVAEDGADALAKFTDGRFDIVFTDLGMPGISGWQVAEQIKRESPDLPVVMVTGWGHQLDPSQVERSGVSRVLTKPFQWVTVLDTLSALVPRR